jgi:hypothetical protein
MNAISGWRSDAFEIEAVNRRRPAGALLPPS